MGTFKFLSQEAFHSYLFKSFRDGILWVIKYHGLGQNVLHKDSHRSVKPSCASTSWLGFCSENEDADEMALEEQIQTHLKKTKF